MNNFMNALVKSDVQSWRVWIQNLMGYVVYTVYDRMRGSHDTGDSYG